MRIPALVLALILPLIMVFSAALVIQAGIRMDSAEDLKTKDYFQTSAFADSFYSKASTILSGISAREILDKTNEDAYIDLGELYNGDSLSFKRDHSIDKMFQGFGSCNITFFSNMTNDNRSNSLRFTNLHNSSSNFSYLTYRTSS